MIAKRLVPLVASSLAALVSLPAHADTMEPAPATCRVLEFDYAAACGETDNLHSLARLREAEDCVLIEVDSRSRWNASGLIFEDGVTYKLEVQGDGPSWCDASIRSSPDGWKVPDEAGESKFEKCDGPGKVTFGFFQLSLLRFGKWLSRASDQNLFTLMGVTSIKKGEPFKIGMGTEHKAKADGEFCSYANDTTFTYANNDGSLMLKVIRISE